MELTNGQDELEAVYDRTGAPLQVKEVKPNDARHHYEVWIIQGKNRKRLFFDPEGVFLGEQ